MMLAILWIHNLLQIVPELRRLPHRSLQIKTPNKVPEQRIEIVPTYVKNTICKNRAQVKNENVRIETSTPNDIVELRK